MMHCLLLLPLFVGVLCFVLVFLCSALGPLSYDVASESEITPCIKIDKPLVVYIFTVNVMTSITTLRT